MREDWARPLTDATAFAEEQAKLAHVWTFLGLVDDAPKDGDWFRASLAGRAVFVQRFGEVLRGFENVCAHRFFPVRTADKGHGPIVCGFHHWRYDEEGRLAGAPRCEGMFGVAADRMGARLKTVEIALCGDLVFGRFPAPEATDTLEAFLDESFPILAAMSKPAGPRRRFSFPVQANWRLCMHISLEDYHIVAIHPSTFGRAGYQDREKVGYYRVGQHSARIGDLSPDAVAAMAAASRAGTWRSQHYRVFQIFPSLVISHFHAGDENWYIAVQHYAPAAVDRTELRSWIYPSPFAVVGRPRHDRWTGRFTRPGRALVVEYFARKVAMEDRAAVERLQTVAAQVERAPTLGALEERVAWFEETYDQVMSRGLP